MSSHHEWVEKIIMEHNNTKPFSPENGEELKYQIGDPIVYTNDYGVKFNQTVVGLYAPQKIDAQYALGARYMLDTDCHWVPVKETALSLNRKVATEIVASLKHKKNSYDSEDAFDANCPDEAQQLRHLGALLSEVKPNYEAQHAAVKAKRPTCGMKC